MSALNVVISAVLAMLRIANISKNRPAGRVLVLFGKSIFLVFAKTTVASVKSECLH